MYEVRESNGNEYSEWHRPRDGRRQRPRGPEATLVRIRAILVERSVREPWHPENVERITGSGWFLRLPWEGDDDDDDAGDRAAPIPRYVATCNHCVEGVQAHNGITLQTSSTGDALIPARVVAVMPSIDLAVLEIMPHVDGDDNDLDTSAIKAWPLGDDRSDIEIDDVVHVYGYPLGQDRLKSTESHVNGRETDLIQLDGSINEGDSGAPVVRDGRVVGWVSEGVPGTAVSFAKPISLLLAVIFAIQVPPIVLGPNSAPADEAATISRRGLQRASPMVPPAQVLRRGTLGCLWYPATNDHLTLIGARCKSPLRSGTTEGAPLRKSTRRRGIGSNDAADEACDCSTGVVIEWISPDSDLADDPFRTRPGDILCGIALPMIPPGGYRALLARAIGPRPDWEHIVGVLARASRTMSLSIHNDGTVVMPWTGDRVNITHALMMVPMGLDVGVRVFSANDRTSIEGTVHLQHSRAGFSETYNPFEPVDYETFGGIVVGPLTTNVINAFPQLGARLLPHERQDDRLVLLRGFVGGTLSAGAPQDPNVVLHEGELLARVNGVPVRTMDEYRAALRVPLLLDHQTGRLVPVDHIWPPSVLQQFTALAPPPHIPGAPPSLPFQQEPEQEDDASVERPWTADQIDTLGDHILGAALDAHPHSTCYLVIETDRGRSSTVAMPKVLEMEPVLAAQYDYPLSDALAFYQTFLGS